MPDTQERFVVMSTLVNDHRQGDVIHADALKTFDPDDATKVRHDAKQRLLDMGAIRPASEAEAALARVPATQVGLSPAQTLAIQTLDATIEKLTQDVAAHEERARAHERLRNTVAPLPSPEEDPAFAMALLDRQARIEQLQARLDAATGQADEHREALTEQSRQAAEKAPKSGDVALTGQAMPEKVIVGQEPSPEELKQANVQREQAAQEQAARRQRQEQEARQQAEAAEREQHQRRGRKGHGEQ